MREGGREGGSKLPRKRQRGEREKGIMEPLNRDTFGTSCFVLCREVVLFQR